VTFFNYFFLLLLYNSVFYYFTVHFYPKIKRRIDLKTFSIIKNAKRSCLLHQHLALDFMLILCQTGDRLRHQDQGQYNRDHLIFHLMLQCKYLHQDELALQLLLLQVPQLST
jgi:hypothetical protein